MGSEPSAPKTNAAYRDDDGPARLRVAEIVEQQREELGRLSPEITDLHARRVARSAFGAVAFGGGLITFLLSVLGPVLYGSRWPVGASGGGPMLLLLASWVAGGLAYGAAREVAPRLLRKEIAAGLTTTGDARADLARLEAHPPAQRARELTEARERASAALPLMGAGWLAPLTLHLAVYAVGLVISMPWSGDTRLVDFDQWMLVSAILTTQCHALLAHGAWRFAKAARAAPTSEIATVVPGPQSAMYRALLGSLVPGLVTMLAIMVSGKGVEGFGIGLVMMLVMAGLVGVTGLAFVPFMFGRMRKTLAAERGELEEAASRAAEGGLRVAEEEPALRVAAPAAVDEAVVEAEAELEAEAAPVKAAARL
jgi:hypothetical protein